MIKDIIKNNSYYICLENNLICIKNYIRIIDISETFIKIKLNNKTIKINSDNEDIIKIINDSLNDNDVSLYKRKVSFYKLNSIKNKILVDNKDTLEWIEIREKGCKYYIEVTPSRFLDEIPENLVEYHQPKELTEEETGAMFSDFLGQLKAKM